MSLVTDFASVVAVWGQSLTIVRRTVSYSNSGDATPTWAQQEVVTGHIQPAKDTPAIRTQSGIEVRADNICFLPAASTIQENDRIREAGWVAGNDEHEVLVVNDFSPSHIEAKLKLVKGHGG
jgi:hypothetical protein